MAPCLMVHFLAISFLRLSINASVSERATAIAVCSAGDGSGTIIFLNDAPSTLGNVEPVDAARILDTPEMT